MRAAVTAICVSASTLVACGGHASISNGELAATAFPEMDVPVACRIEDGTSHGTAYNRVCGLKLSPFTTIALLRVDGDRFCIVSGAAPVGEKC